jgi:hypothetical protein
MKIVRLAADELFVRERPDLFGFDQDNVLGVLHLAFDQEKWFLGNQEPHALKQIRSHDGV